MSFEDNTRLLSAEPVSVPLCVCVFSSLEMRVHHALTNRPPWGPSDHLVRVDAALSQSGSLPLADLDVGAFDLEPDGDHYTREEYVRFAAQLAHAVRGMPCPLIVSDSTIDWHNHASVDEWTWTGWASEVLETALGAGRGVVDVVCGSGFVARAAQHEHFHARVSRHLRAADARITDVVLIGGWNDADRTAAACASAARLVSLVQRY